MIGKVVVSGISIILVVGVVIGVVAGVHRFGNDNATENMTPHMKAVTSICAPTDYKEACIKSLSPVAQNNDTTDPKEFIKAAIKAVMNEFNTSLKLTDTLLPSANDSQVKMGIEDCKDLFDTSVQELQASFSMVGDSDLHTVNNRAAELLTWLSAVISYSTSCVDGIADPKIQSAMKNGLVDAKQLTSNALAIVSALQSVLSTFNLRLDAKPSARRLLGNTEVGSDGFPTWFSAADRKLLGRRANGGVKPNAVVAKDGSGQFKTISAAIAAIPSTFKGRYVIYVKAGVYNEYILIDKKKPSIYMYGDGSRRTVVTGNKSFKSGYTTSKTATFAVEADGFLCTNMGFHNTAGAEGHQAVAIRVQSDRAAFFNCRMDAYQDTLYVQAKRQFYRNCIIAGTVDFIFGDSSTLIQNCKIIVRRPSDNQYNTVTAQGKDERHETTGIVIHNCNILPEARLFPDRFKIKTYLGRPWKQFSMTVVMESGLADFIHPEGWRKWDGENFESTLFYAEYGNRGPGANVRGRVKWGGFHVISKSEAFKYTAGPFIQAGQWLRDTKVPFLAGLKA